MILTFCMPDEAKVCVYVIEGVCVYVCVRVYIDGYNISNPNHFHF